MRFCPACGGALEFFEFLDGELCTSCRKQSTAAATVRSPAADPASSALDIPEAILCREDERLVLKSPEGWILWSGPDTESHQLQTILTRARRILEIRRKRRQN